MHFIAKTRTYSDDITITAEIEKQLRDGVSRADVKITLRLTHIKELNRKSIHELYEHMRKIPEVITKGLKLLVLTKLKRTYLRDKSRKFFP